MFGRIPSFRGTKQSHEGGLYSKSILVFLGNNWQIASYLEMTESMMVGVINKQIATSCLLTMAYYFTKYMPKNTAKRPITKLAMVYKAKLVKSPDFKNTWFS